MIWYGLGEENWAFCTDPAWKHKLQVKYTYIRALMAHAGALMAPKAITILPQVLMEHGQTLMALEVAPDVRILAFFFRFRSFFRLETPRNLK
jgi:hypothetical protein